MSSPRSLLLLALTLTLGACTGSSDDPDGDGDGWGASVDCDDASDAVFPGADEITADGVDQNCDGLDTCYFDGDEDGFGTDFVIGGDDLECGNRHGESTTTDDCDDTRSFVNPTAEELAGNGMDEDCDGKVACFVDIDSDGFGTSATVTDDDGSCDDDAGQARYDSDCDDAQAARFPGAEELVGDAIDQDCNAALACYEDLDGDGFGSDVIVDVTGASCEGDKSSDIGGDCVDTDPTVKPGSPRTIQASDYPSMQDAVDHACVGDTVQLPQGGFYLDRTLDLGSRGIHLVGHADGTSLQATQGPTVQLQAGSVTGLYLSSPYQDSDSDDDGVKVGGILVLDATDVRLEYLTIEGGRGSETGGIAVVNSTGVDLTKVSVNNSSGALTGAIFIDDSDDVSLTEVVVSSSSGGVGGIRIEDSFELALDKVTVSSNSGWDGTGGIELRGSKDVTLTEVMFNQNSGKVGGMLIVDSSSVSFEDVSASSGYGSDGAGGIEVRGSTDIAMFEVSLSSLNSNASGAGIGIYDSKNVSWDGLNVDSTSSNSDAAAIRISGTTGLDLTGSMVSNAYSNGPTAAVSIVGSEGHATNWLVTGSMGSGGSVMRVEDSDLLLENVGLGMLSLQPLRIESHLADAAVELRNCAVLGNQSTGVIVNASAGAVTFVNTMVAYNAGYGVNSEGSVAPTFRYSYVANNSGGNVSGVTDPAGTNGNVSGDPAFYRPDQGSYFLLPISPLRDGGDPALLDPDGSRSDIGLWGGPAAVGFEAYDDTDNDGMDDGWEQVYSLSVGSDDGANDNDTDTLTNLEEFQNGTDPSRYDTDSDMYSDADEVLAGSDPRDPTDIPQLPQP